MNEESGSQVDVLESREARRAFVPGAEQTSFVKKGDRVVQLAPGEDD